jgi:hypothetical protein
MHVTRKFFALSALTLGLSACGGGGDDTSDNTSTTPPPPPPPPPPAYSVTVDSADSVEESSSLTVGVSTSGGEGSESITASIRRAGEDSDDETGGNASDVTIEQNSDGFVFEFGDISLKQRAYTITIDAAKGDESESKEFDVVVKNTSGDETAAYVNSVQSILPAQRQFIAEWLMVERLVKGVNLSGGDIDIKDIKALYVNATSGDGVDDDSLLSAYVNDERLTGYDTNSISESDAFDSFLANVSAETCESPRCFSEHLVGVKPMFDYIFERSGGVVQEPAYGDVGFDAGTGTYSIFYTAPDNGSFDDQGNWTFKPEFEYLTDTIVVGHAAAQTFSSAE